MMVTKGQLEILKKGIKAVSDLMEESEGVTGLHLNGNVAYWSELCRYGEFSQWLSDFNAAEEIIDGLEV